MYFIMKEDFKLTDLTTQQQNRLINYYNVSSLDKLHVQDDGNIVVKKEGGGKQNHNIYIQDHDNVNHKLDIDTFLKNQKNPSLGFINIDKKEAKKLIEEFINKIVENKKNNDMSVLVIEHGSEPNTKTILFQQMIIYYSDKLRSVLCGNIIEKKYIRATGNPAFSDIDFYNIIKKDNNIIIKGFAFCDFHIKNELFINVVCGTGGTASLIRAIEEGVKNNKFQKKATYIALETVPTKQAISFYAYLGFKKKDKDTNAIIKQIKKSKVNSFEEFLKDNKKISGGLLYLNPPDKIKANHVYNLEKWWSEIKKGNEPTLDGSGIGSFLTDAFNRTKNFIATRFKPNVSDFTNQSKKILGQYGNGIVTKLIVQRKPIVGILDKIINGLSFGSFQKAKNKYGYDKLFHLQLAAYVRLGRGTTKIVIEKNETVDLSVSTTFTQTKDVEFLVIPFNKQFTLNDLVNDARKEQGDQKFFEYDAFKNNCQWFIYYLLHGQELYTDRAKSFLFQDLENFTKELPGWLPGFARRVTDLGATVANLRGKGKDDIETYIQTNHKYRYFIRQGKKIKKLGSGNNKEELESSILSKYPILNGRTIILETLSEPSSELIEANKKSKIKFGYEPLMLLTEEVKINDGEFTRVAPISRAGFTERYIDKNKEIDSKIFIDSIVGNYTMLDNRVYDDEPDLEGGVGARKYITAAEREAKRNEAIKASTYAPTVEARKAEEERMKGIQEYNETISKKPKKKTIKDYQAEEKFYKDLKAKEEAERKAKEEAESKAREEAKEEADRLEAERLAEVARKKEEFQERKRQRAADVKAYKEGRIDDIKDNELRSRAQTERNLGQFYDFKDKVYKTKIEQEKENAMNQILPSLLQMGINKIPKIGSVVNDLVDATGAKDDTSEDKARRAYIEQGPPERPDVLEGYREDIPEPDFEGSGKNNLHAVIISKNVPLNKAKEEAQKFINNPNRKYFRDTKKSYRFRNESKQKFDPKTFRTKIINSDISLIFGNPIKQRF